MGVFKRKTGKARDPMISLEGERLVAVNHFPWNIPYLHPQQCLEQRNEGYLLYKLFKVVRRMNANDLNINER